MSRAGHASAGADRKAAGVTFPLTGIGLSTVAMLFLGAGALALLEPGTVPQLASPAVAWSLIAVGIVLDVAAIMSILRARNARARRGAAR